MYCALASQSRSQISATLVEISELRRIAAFAETYNVSMAPHSPLGPINLAASLQLDFATPNFLIQEQVIGLGIWINCRKQL